MQNLLYHIKNSELSKETLAAKSGISIDRINGFLQMSVEPTMSDVRKLSKALKLSTDFLLADNSKFQEINVLFRKAIGNAKEKEKADKISYIVGNTFTLLQNYKGNQRLFADFPEVSNTFLNARLLAGKFRKIFCQNDFISPLLHLPVLVSDELKCILFITDLGKNVDGASAIINTVPFIFISPRFEPRMLFTLAHELGHIIAHHNKEVNFAKFDKDISELGKNNLEDESFANFFASELLLPEEGVGITLQKVRSHFKIEGDLGDVEIIYLSRIYGVSFEVAAKRCEDLQLIPRGGAFSLYRKLIEDHQSPEKRATELGIPERPEIEFPKVSATLINSALAKVNSGEISLGKASEILSISITDIINYNAIE